MCLNGDNCSQAKWYKKLKDKMGRQIFHRKLHETGSAQTNRDNELFLKHVSQGTL